MQEVFGEKPMGFSPLDRGNGVEELLGIWGKVCQSICIAVSWIDGSDCRMWCVVHVKDGGEGQAEAFVAGLLPGELNARCFHLIRSRRKKYEGEWQTVYEDLFPGYVFIDTDQPEKVYKELKKTPKPNLLFSDDEYVSTLEEHETELMERLADRRGRIGISRVRIGTDGKISYLSGPLLGMGNRVRRVNLHKRIAEIETEIMGRKRLLYLGIEIEADERRNACET